MINKWVYVLAVVLLLVLVWWGIGAKVSQVEQPSYQVTAADGAIEVRQYPQMIVAEVEIRADQRRALGLGFRPLADYIFGANAPKQKIAMTAPVQQQGLKIAMTAPVQQQAAGALWRIRFIMPKTWQLAELPQPNNPAVKLKTIPAMRYAVIRFSGVASSAKLQRYTERLHRYMQQQQLTPSGTPIYAFYNPPWTLPFLRRNEVMMAIAE